MVDSLADSLVGSAAIHFVETINGIKIGLFFGVVGSAVLGRSSSLICVKLSVSSWRLIQE